MAIEVTLENFDNLIGGDKLTMIDFSAQWCGPCKTLAPIVEQLAEEYAGKAVIGTCDVEECNAITAKYLIRNVPTILFFKKGELVYKQVGALAKATLSKRIEELM